MLEDPVYRGVGVGVGAVYRLRHVPKHLPHAYTSVRPIDSPPDAASGPPQGLVSRVSASPSLPAPSRVYWAVAPPLIANAARPSTSRFFMQSMHRNSGPTGGSGRGSSGTRVRSPTGAPLPTSARASAAQLPSRRPRRPARR